MAKIQEDVSKPYQVANDPAKLHQLSKIAGAEIDDKSKTHQMKKPFKRGK